MPTGKFNIVTDTIVRDARMERRIIEQNRDRLLYAILLLGSVLMLMAVLY
jgi:hypothetical protein